MSMLVRNYVVCSSRNCDWGFYLPDLAESRLNDCCADFRRHCIEHHGLRPDDAEAYAHLDLVEYTVMLLKYDSDTGLERVVVGQADRSGLAAVEQIS